MVQHNQHITVERRDSSGEDPIHLRYSADLAIYFDDVKEIRERLLRKGWEVSHRETADLWREYSAWMMASWLIIDESTVEQFLEWLDEK